MIRRRGHHKAIVKEALGLAGSNAIRLFEPELLETQRRWIANTTANGRQLVVEPWLERELDFSVQLEMADDGLKLCGYTGLINDAKGQFQGNVACRPSEKNPGKPDRAFPRAAGHRPALACNFTRRSLRCLKQNCAAQIISARSALTRSLIATRTARFGSNRLWKSIRAIRWDD